jgi:uncharacterized protein YkwD
VHHVPAGPPTSERLAGTARRTAARARRAAALHPRRAVPLLVLAVVLAVLGIATPVVSGAVTGGTPVSLDASAASGSALRSGGIRMGVDGRGAGAPTVPAGRPAPAAAGGSTSTTSPAAGGSSHAAIGNTAAAGTSGRGGTATTAATPSTGATAGTSGAGTPAAGTTATGRTTPGTARAGATAGAATGTPSVTRGSSPVPDPTAADGTPAADGPAAGASSSEAAAPAVATAPAVVSGTGDAVLDRVNAARADAGCPDLTADPRLTARAQGHSTAMAVAGRLGLSGTGGTAVVARGPADAASVVAGWLADRSDRTALLDCDRTSFGAAEATGHDGPWWTAVLA